MRSAVMILGILLLIFILLQSWILGFGGVLLDDSVLTRGGAIGRFVAIIIGAGIFFVMKKPFISAIIFSTAGAAAILAGAVIGYYDLVLWGGLSFGLALLSYASRREIGDKSKADQNIGAANQF